MKSQSILSCSDLGKQFRGNARHWLTSTASLTQRLRELTHHQIAHHLFLDNWGEADHHFRNALQLTTAEKTWIRKMEWRYRNTVWVACTVVIPEITTQHAPELMQIGKHSIGETLFQDAELQRSHFIFFQDANISNSISRYSIFHYQHYPLLISETFFPAFFQGIKKCGKN